MIDLLRLKPGVRIRIGTVVEKIKEYPVYCKELETYLVKIESEEFVDVKDIDLILKMTNSEISNRLEKIINQLNEYKASEDSEYSYRTLNSSIKKLESIVYDLK